MDVAVDGPEIDRLCARTTEFIVAGRLSAARPLVAALKRLAPRSARTAELSAMLAIRAGDVASARSELDAAIADWPDRPGLHLQRSALGRFEGNTPVALDEAAQAVLLDPASPHAKALLGLALLDAGQPQDAAVCLAESLAAQPANSVFRLALSEAETARGNHDAARTILHDGIRLAPADIACRKAAMLVAVQNNRFAEAVELAEAARRAGVVDAVVYGLAGHALSKLNRHAEAIGYYDEARKLGPDDPYVRHLVAAAGGIPSPDQASPAYVRAVFDDYAPTFEAHLLALGYRIPGLIRRALLRHTPLGAGQPYGPILDLGCGTGLMAVALLDLPAGPLTGVDLSPGMLKQAAAKHLYETLHEAEISAFLSADDASYAAVTAADLFCYVGDLQPVLTLIRPRIAPGGICAFTVEALGDAGGGPGWELGPNGRYRHAAGYVRASAVAAGFEVLDLAEENLRREVGTPVPGLIAVCRAA